MIEVFSTNHYKNKIKLELCNKYYMYLLIIDVLSEQSGYVLKEQLINTLIEFGIEKKKATAVKKIIELKKGEVIKEQRFIKNSRFLVLKKFAKKYLIREVVIDAVAGVPIPTSNYSYYKNIFKAEYCLRELVPYIKKEGEGAWSIEEILKYRCTSYFINNESFMWNLMENFLLEVNKEEIRKDARILKEKREIQLKLLKKEISTAEFQQVEEFNISNLQAKNVVVDTCTFNQEVNEFRVKLNYFDYRDRQDIEDIIYVYSMAYSVFRRLIKFNYTVYVDMKVCTSSIEASHNIKGKLLRVKSQEANGKHTKLDEVLSKYNVSPAFLKIELENYDIANKYFK